ncbi:MAG: hypothetical protein ACE5IT_04930 [bacterium]
MTEALLPSHSMREFSKKPSISDTDVALRLSNQILLKILRFAHFSSPSGLLPSLVLQDSGGNLLHTIESPFGQSIYRVSI